MYDLITFGLTLNGRRTTVSLERGLIDLAQATLNLPHRKAVRKWLQSLIDKEFDPTSHPTRQIRHRIIKNLINSNLQGRSMHNFKDLSGDLRSIISALKAGKLPTALTERTLSRCFKMQEAGLNVIPTINAINALNEVFQKSEDATAQLESALTFCQAQA